MSIPLEEKETCEEIAMEVGRTRERISRKAVSNGEGRCTLMPGPLG